MKPKRKGETRATMAAKFPPPDEFHWRAGPYRAPKVKVGAVLRDEYRGENVRVEGMTEAPIPWPGIDYKRGERLLPVLCGDLVRAVCEEDELTVAYYWNVTRYMVEQWKRAISKAHTSNGVFAGLALKRNDPEFRQRFGYK
jgi:hypothetical protein